MGPPRHTETTSLLNNPTFVTTPHARSPVDPSPPSWAGVPRDRYHDSHSRELPVLSSVLLNVVRYPSWGPRGSCVSDPGPDEEEGEGKKGEGEEKGGGRRQREVERGRGRRGEKGGGEEGETDRSGNRGEVRETETGRTTEPQRDGEGEKKTGRKGTEPVQRRADTDVVPDPQRPHRGSKETEVCRREVRRTQHVPWGPTSTRHRVPRCTTEVQCPPSAKRREHTPWTPVHLGTHA